MALLFADLRQRVVAAAERRLPALTRFKRREALPIRLDRRRIYVVPSGFGASFAMLLLVMLLGALNYSNNPAVLLTCLLGATAGASLYAGFRMVDGLTLVGVRAGEAYAGQTLPLRLRFAASRRGRADLCIRRGDTGVAFALPAATETDVELPFVAERRGWQRPGRLRLSTEHPLGFFHFWSWLNPDAAFLVYAAPESPAPPLPAGDGRMGERAQAGASEEHAGLRSYRPADPARLIAWKASVRHDTLLVRDAERRSGDLLTLDYRALAGLDDEARISRLTAWVLAAENAQRAYLLRLPDESIGPGLGAAQRSACLRALAVLPGAEDAA